MTDSAAGFSISGAEWLGARAALAGRRSGRFALGATATFAVIVLAFFLVPKLGGAAPRDLPLTGVVAAAAVLAAIIGFSINLLAEIGRPKVATAREAEHAAQAPVLATVHDRPREADELDPFGFLYLGVTARGMRIRTIAISGNDRAVLATVAGRLARAAAADESATLVVDTNAETSPVAGYYLERPEPGLTDIIAGVRSWREVARSVGASDGLPIDVVPAGSIRRDPPDATAARAARKEFRGRSAMSLISALLRRRGLLRVSDLPRSLNGQR